MIGLTSTLFRLFTTLFWSINRNKISSSLIGPHDHVSPLTSQELQQLKQCLKTHYRTNLCRIRTDPLVFDSVLDLAEIFTNLWLINEKRKQKHSLDYNDMLTLQINGKPMKRLLVEGEAGAGKTTLCAKIAFDWLSGEGFQEFELVLVIPLRDSEENPTCGELVKAYLPEEVEIAPERIDSFCIKHPDKVLILFDGLDEFKGDISKRNSNDIVIKALRSDSFRESVVMVTTRPWKAHQIRGSRLLGAEYGFIEVRGFRKEDVPKYVRKFFGIETASAESLISFMAENGVITEYMAPYPIFTAMLCVMWRDLPEDKREEFLQMQTFSQLFKTMISFLTDHYISKSVTDSEEGEVLDTAWDEIQKNLLQIGKIALDGLLVKDLVFPECTSGDNSEVKSFGCKVGILSKEKRIAPRQAGMRPRLIVRVTFPHKLFQENIAGRYLASLHETDREKYDGWMNKVLASAKEFRYLLYFTTSFGKDVGCDVVTKLTSRISINPNPFIPESIGLKTNSSGDIIDRDFILDVAFESQEREVASTTDSILQTKGEGSHLEIPKHMATHTILGCLYTLSHLVSGKIPTYFMSLITYGNSLAFFRKRINYIDIIICLYVSLKSFTV